MKNIWNSGYCIVWRYYETIFQYVIEIIINWLNSDNAVYEYDRLYYEEDDFDYAEELIKGWTISSITYDDNCPSFSVFSVTPRWGEIGKWLKIFRKRNTQTMHLWKNCGAELSYEKGDIKNGGVRSFNLIILSVTPPNYIICPQCKHPIEVEVDQND